MYDVEHYPLGPTATLVERAIEHGKQKAHELRLEIAPLKGERDRLTGENLRLTRELDVYKRAHMGDV